MIGVQSDYLYAVVFSQYGISFPVSLLHVEESVPDLAVRFDVQQKERDEKIHPVVNALPSDAIVSEDPVLVEE